MDIDLTVYIHVHVLCTFVLIIQSSMRLLITDPYFDMHRYWDYPIYFCFSGDNLTVPPLHRYPQVITLL